MASPDPPSAATISLPEALALLDGDARPAADGVANGKFALWLGSGISMNTVPGLSGAIHNVLEFLQSRADHADEKCEHRRALKDAIGLVELGETEASEVDLTRPVDEWPHLERILRRLVRRYSELLDLRVRHTSEDYLLWEGVDIQGTYAASLAPGTEHLCIAILTLEGVIQEIPSANWDGLIEAAIQELAVEPAQSLEVYVLNPDFQDPRTAPRLLKFHGCAVLAAQHPTEYRAALIGRRSQITEWTEHPESSLMCRALTTLATEKRTLMIGLSAQDEDIQNVFTKAKALMPWVWEAASPAYAFAEQTIGDMQKNLLKVVYRQQYQDHVGDIEEGALIQAYAEPLLAALVLDVLAAKLGKYIQHASAPALTASDRVTLAEGITQLRNEAAARIEPDRREAIRLSIKAQRRALELFRTGEETAPDDTRYSPLSQTTVEGISSDAGLTTGGMPALAAALGILGRGESDATWTLEVASAASSAPGALTVSSATGTNTAIHFAANSRSAIRQEALASVIGARDDTIFVHSVRPIANSPRSPRVGYGRTGRSGIRHVDMEDLLGRCTSIKHLEEQFRSAASI